MNRARVAAFLLAVVIRAGAESSGEELPIGIIDFYGLGRVSESEARRALTVKEGDTVSLLGDEPPAFMAESERRLSALPGVGRAHVEFVCCDAGRWIVYVGLEGSGDGTTHFRPAPRGTVRLAADIVRAGSDFDRVFMEAIQAGDAAEDRSLGHALNHDPATRAIQERFIGYAARDLKDLRRVLRDSSDAQQRALAAQVLGYVAHKQEVVGDLVYAMSDSSGEVRNNAMRALALFAGMAPSAGRPLVRVPAEPFVGLLRSLVWTDRNKASLALMGLTARRDPDLLEKLRREAIVPLVEMARWKSEGHTGPALTILGRIGGLSDEAIATALERGEREGMINTALERR
jgi:hypothetical protein